MIETNGENLMNKIISLCKRRGFVFPGSELYGGLAGTYTYGQLGSVLKNNIRDSWLKYFVTSKDNMYLIDAPILMHPKVWEASGHTTEFIDPLVECAKCKHRFRADQIEDLKKCADCGGQLGEPRNFNLMLETKLGAVSETATTTYLRPEEAQSMFVHFKDVLDSSSPKIPFGIAQIGKAFRNEITPRDFIYRLREFEIVEFEYFINPKENWEGIFDQFLKEQKTWLSYIGIPPESLHPHEHAPTDRAHYSKKTIDLEFDYPFGTKELTGLSHRGDFDLKQHQKFSGQTLEIVDEETNEKYVPHVIEPTVSLDRAFLALLCSSYTEDEMNGETRTYLKFKPNIAPVICAVSPLLKNKPELITKAREVFTMLKNEFGRVMWDDNGNIGKRYRRQDEIGTPWCIVVDFDTLGENPELLDTVTIRDRDTGKQERVKISDLAGFIKEKLA